MGLYGRPPLALAGFRVHTYTSNLRDAPTNIAEIVVDIYRIYRIGASFISWS